MDLSINSILWRLFPSLEYRHTEFETLILRNTGRTDIFSNMHATNTWSRDIQQGAWIFPIMNSKDMILSLNNLFLWYSRYMIFFRLRTCLSVRCNSRVEIIRFFHYVQYPIFLKQWMYILIVSMTPPCRPCPRRVSSVPPIYIRMINLYN